MEGKEELRGCRCGVTSSAYANMAIITENGTKEMRLVNKEARALASSGMVAI